MLPKRRPKGCWDAVVDVGGGGGAGARGWGDCSVGEGSALLSRKEKTKQPSDGISTVSIEARSRVIRLLYTDLVEPSRAEPRRTRTRHPSIRSAPTRSRPRPLELEVVPPATVGGGDLSRQQGATAAPRRAPPRRCRAARPLSAARLPQAKPPFPSRNLKFLSKISQLCCNVLQSSG
ncbi:unnamed protein product [Urochloa humidicola]